MRFVTIHRRGGEAIPINPEMVCFMRTAGNLTTIAMADGQSFRVELGAAELVKAFTKGGDSIELEEPEKPPAEAAAPAPEALGASGAQIAPGAPPAGDLDADDDEDAKEQGRAQRAQEAEPGHKPANASRK